MKKYLIVMGLALGLPSTLIGVFALLYNLVQAGLISWNVSLVIMVLVSVNTLYLMIRYVNKKKD